MSKRPWMPFYVGDYLKNTGHLSLMEHGAYLLLMCHYWEAGSLPIDDDELALIARMPKRDWLKHREKLSRLFGANWKHARIEDEISKSVNISGKRRDAANARYHGANIIPLTGGAK